MPFFFFFFCCFLELFGLPTFVSRPWPSTLAVNEDGQGHCDVYLWFLNTQEPPSIFIYGQ